MVHEFLKSFKFDSVDQEKGALAALGWLQSKGFTVSSYSNMDEKLMNGLRPMDLFFIQKDHDSHEYWLELFGNQISTLQREIKALQDQVMELKA